MRGYLDYIEETFLGGAGWDVQDSYANLTINSRDVLDFSIPLRTSLSVSSNVTANTFASHEIANIASLTGSISYLYSSMKLPPPPSSCIPLSALTQHFRPTFSSTYNDIIKSSPQALLFGRMNFPGQQLEAMYIQTYKNSAAVTKWVVDPRLEVPVVLTTTLQNKTRNWSREFVYSTHENLFGMRLLALVNSWKEKSSESRIVTGCEAFYASNKKSPGLSVGMKYQTQASKNSKVVPLTLSFVTNPLMGSVSLAYSLKPTPLLALASKFDYNLYSYLSDLTLGCEIWRTNPISLSSEDLATKREGPVSVLKVSTSLASQTARIVWEGSIKDIILNVGVNFCFSDPKAPVSSGIAFTYSA